MQITKEYNCINFWWVYIMGLNLCVASYISLYFPQLIKRSINWFVKRFSYYLLTLPDSFTHGTCYSSLYHYYWHKLRNAFWPSQYKRNDNKRFNKNHVICKFCKDKGHTLELLVYFRIWQPWLPPSYSTTGCISIQPCQVYIFNYSNLLCCRSTSSHLQGSI